MSMARLGLVTAALLTATGFAQEIHSDLCLYGCPSGSPSGNDLIIRDFYMLSSNDVTKLADWAAYVVTSETQGWGVSRENRVYLADPVLHASETLEPGDYVGAPSEIGIDRGHLVPLEAFSATDQWDKLNYLSNITPQGQSLNRGAWWDLDAQINKTLTRLGPVYVMTGTLYESSRPRLPRSDESHLTPSGYWKIVAMEPYPGVVAASAVAFPHDTPLRARYCSDRYWTTVREIERATGLDFFHALSRSKQNEIEVDNSTSLRMALGC